MRNKLMPLLPLKMIQVTFSCATAWGDVDNFVAHFEGGFPVCTFYALFGGFLTVGEREQCTEIKSFLRPSHRGV